MDILLMFQYFLELMKVPRVESKLRVFSFKIQFSSQVWWYLLFFPDVNKYNQTMSSLHLVLIFELFFRPQNLKKV